VLPQLRPACHIPNAIGAISKQIEGRIIKTIIIVAGLAASLGGCITATQEQQVASEIAQCRVSKKTYFQKAECANAAERRVSGDNPLLAMKYVSLITANEGFGRDADHV
jgi:hypothetical protein